MAGTPFALFEPAQNHASQPEADGPTLAWELDVRRKRSLDVLNGITDEDLETSADRAKLGPLTLREHLNEWAAHDLMHMVQADRAIMQAFIPNTGVFRGYFKDHDVDAA